MHGCNIDINFTLFKSLTRAQVYGLPHSAYNTVQYTSQEIANHHEPRNLTNYPTQEKAMLIQPRLVLDYRYSLFGVTANPPTELIHHPRGYTIPSLTPVPDQLLEQLVSTILRSLLP